MCIQSGWIHVVRMCVFVCMLVDDDYMAHFHTTTMKRAGKSQFQCFQRTGNDLIYEKTDDPIHLFISIQATNTFFSNGLNVEMWMKPIVLGHHVTFLNEKKNHQKVQTPKTAWSFSLFLSVSFLPPVCWFINHSYTHHSIRSPIRKKSKVSVSLVYHLFLCWLDAFFSFALVQWLRMLTFALFITNQSALHEQSKAITYCGL